MSDRKRKAEARARLLAAAGMTGATGRVFDGADGLLERMSPEWRCKSCGTAQWWGFRCSDCGAQRS